MSLKSLSLVHTASLNARTEYPKVTYMFAWLFLRTCESLF